jgi:hypothetical protein
MDLPPERNRAANKDAPLLIAWTITYFFDVSQIIYYYFLLKVVMERGGQKVLCINFKGLSTSLEGFNFLPMNWKELIRIAVGGEDWKFSWIIVETQDYRSGRQGRESYGVKVPCRQLPDSDG